jgi:aminoglycoside 3-N-acetyltransferase I
MSDAEHAVRRLGPGDLALMRGMLTLFGEVFAEPDTYGGAVPDDAYLARLLGKPTFIALVAIAGHDVIGGLAAYELEKFEQARSEIYIYDLAVAAAHRRRGIATALIERVCQIGDQCGAHVVFVQADPGDDPAIALYGKLGRREDVHHFDIAVAKRHK